MHQPQRSPGTTTHLTTCSVCLAAVLVACASFANAVHAQSKPKEDLIDVPAVGSGFCVSNLFQDHMVLQRDKPIHIWGWANPGASVTAKFFGEEVTAQAATDRRWQLTFSPKPAQHAPETLTLRSGDETIELNDILVGDVWLLGGQSNMEFELAKVENGNLEILSANYPQIRILTVPYGEGPELQKGFARLDEWSGWFGRHFRKGDWDVCSPDVARELSAIGYVFARRIHMASEVPIGVIDASRGGTTVETWTPLGTLQQMESELVQAKLTEFSEAAAAWDAEADLQKRIAQHHQWIARQQKAGNPIPEDRKQEPSDLRPGPLGDHNYPGHCYAGMISPLAGLSLKGVIFHQGYNNAFEGSVGAERYREVLPVMIQAWRQAFHDPQLPFGILSLCTDGYPQTRADYCEKMFNAGIDIRAAQYQTFLELYKAGDTNIGFASTYDLRRRWYHPQLKIPAGERLARWAVATQYGFQRDVEWKPPMLVSMEKAAGSLSLTMDREVGDPQDGDIQGFAIAGEDRKFHPANVAYAEKGKDARGRTQLDRKKLILTSSMVAEPIHFRYAWGRNPLANLQATGNRDLPFATQKSDPWHMEEVPSGVFEDQPQRPISRRDRNAILQALREQDQTRRIKEAQLTLESAAERQ